MWSRDEHDPPRHAPGDFFRISTAIVIQDAVENDNALQQGKRWFVEVVIAHVMQKDVANNLRHARAQTSQ